jgi:hypothetical protein
MAINIEFAKKHWHALAAGLVGLLVLYYLYESYAGASPAPVSSPSSPTDLSGGSGQVLALASQASSQNAATNAQVEVASYSADVANTQTAAQLAATLAASRNATAVSLGAQSSQVAIAGIQGQTAVDLGSQTEAESLAQTKAAVTIQGMVTNADITKTAIEGNTVDQLAATEGQTAIGVQQAKNQVALAAIGVQSKAISTVATLISSGQLNKGGKGGTNQIAALASVTGTSPAAVISADQPSQVANSTPAKISAVGTAASSILGSLFA